MKCRKAVWLGVVVLLAAASSTGAKDPVVLLTREEGAMAEAQATLVEIGRDFSNGPEIQVLQPGSADEGIRSPLTIMVKFIPKTGRPVDLSNFKVECLKIVTIDITKRVLPHTTKEGIRVDGASFPSGEHKLRITLGDVAGSVTQKIFTIKVF